jgi:hypothetical protein
MTGRKDGISGHSEIAPLNRKEGPRPHRYEDTRIAARATSGQGEAFRQGSVDEKKRPGRASLGRSLNF